MARVILEAAGEDVTVGGSDVDVIGTVAPDEVITVTGGSVTLDASFNQGGDTIVLPGAASEYTAFVLNGRLIVTNGTTTLNMPVGSNATTLRFDDGDERDVVVDDGELFVGEQAIDSDGETDLDPGANEAPTTVAGALGAVVIAEQNEDAALEAVARELNSQQAQPRTGAALQSYIDGFDEGDIDTALEAAEARTLNAEAAALQAQAALASARASATDAEVQEAYENALEDAEGDSATQQALADRDEARANLQADVADNGSNTQMLADLEDAILAFAASGGSLSQVISDGTVTPAVPITLQRVLDQINATQATPTDVSDDNNLIDDIGEYFNHESNNFLGGSDAAIEALDDQFDAIEDRDDLIEAVAQEQSDLQAAPEGADLIAAEQALATRQGLVNTANLRDAQLNAAEEDEAALQAAADDFNDAVEASEDANEAVTDLGFDEPVILEDDTEFATSENDVYVFTGEGDSRIVNFGSDGEDILFFGPEYTVVEIDSDEVIGDGDIGDASVLEVFVQQVGGNTVLTFEDEAFSGSEVDGEFDTVTLVAFDADDLNDNSGGFVSAGMDDTSSMLVVSESFA